MIVVGEHLPHRDLAENYPVRPWKLREFYEWARTRNRLYAEVGWSDTAMDSYDRNGGVPEEIQVLIGEVDSGLGNRHYPLLSPRTERNQHRMMKMINSSLRHPWLRTSRTVTHQARPAHH